MTDDIIWNKELLILYVIQEMTEGRVEQLIGKGDARPGCIDLVATVTDGVRELGFCVIGGLGCISGGLRIQNARHDIFNPDLISNRSQKINKKRTLIQSADLVSSLLFSVLGRLPV
jgi:hypothetical protein